MNTPEKLFHTLLGLGDDWEITELEFDKDSGEVRLRIHELPCLLSQQRCPDDGKIFVQDLRECIRIRTGEKGADAIG